MKKFSVIATESVDRVIWHLANLIPTMGVLVARRERAYADRESAVMLELYRAVRSANPQLTGKTLYERIVVHRLNCDETEARRIVRLAGDSYAQWPDDRELMFRDVVHYVIVHHLLAAHTAAVGTRANTEHEFRHHKINSLVYQREDSPFINLVRRNRLSRLCAMEVGTFYF